MKLAQKIIAFTVLSTLLCGCSRYLERDPPGIKTVYEPGPNTTIISHKVCDPGLQKTECDIRLHQANLLEKPNGKQLLEDERKRIAEQEKEASSWEINKFSSEESSGWKKIGFSLEEAIAWKGTGFKPEAAKQWRDMGFSSEQAKYITEQREIQRRLECHNNFPNPWNAYIDLITSQESFFW